MTLKTLEKATLGRMFTLSLLIIILFFTDFHYFCYYFIIAAFFLLFNVREVEIKNFLYFIGSISLSLVALSFMYLPAIFSYLNEKENYVRNYYQTITWYNFFLPSPFTIIYDFFPGNVLRLYLTSPVWLIVDSVIYLGLSFIFLTTFFFLLCRKYNVEIGKIHFLIALIFFSSLLALGTSTTVSLTLNNILRKIVPFFDLLAVSARHVFLTVFSQVMIFSYLTYNALIRMRGYIQFLFFSLVIALFLLEYFPIKYDYYYKVETPLFLYEVSLKPEGFTILNIPHIANTQGMYLQTIHKKAILDGHVSRIPITSRETLALLEKLTREKKAEELKQLLAKLDVRYVIVNYNYDRSYYDFSLLKLLDLVESKRLIATYDRVKVYEILY